MTQEQFFTRYIYDTEIDTIGGGTFGDVYKAYDTVEDRYVAIKVSKRITVNGKTFSLQDEFEATQKLDPHVNIAKYEKLYSYKSPQGVFDYAIMQYYPDGNLKNLLKDQKLTFVEKEDLVLQLLQGIDYLHQNSIIHRDLKPANILISKRDVGSQKYIVKIADFGLSKVAKNNEQSRMSNSFGGGTIEYSSPEQLSAKPLRYNTDLWAFGVIAFEILAGRPLFSYANVGSSAVSENEIIQNILHKDISIDLQELPKQWQKPIAVCLDKNPDTRVKDGAGILSILYHKNEHVSHNEQEEVVTHIFNEEKTSETVQKNSDRSISKAEYKVGNVINLKRSKIKIISSLMVLTSLIISVIAYNNFTNKNNVNVHKVSKVKDTLNAFTDTADVVKNKLKDSITLIKKNNINKKQSPLNSRPSDVSKVVVEELDVDAMPIGGLAAFRNKVVQNIDVSSIKSDANEIKTIASFIVEADGSISNVNSIGSNENFNSIVEQAIIKSNVRWTPAKLENTNVRSRYKMPFTLNLE